MSLHRVCCCNDDDDCIAGKDGYYNTGHGSGCHESAGGQERGCQETHTDVNCGPSGFNFSVDIAIVRSEFLTGQTSNPTDYGSGCNGEDCPVPGGVWPDYPSYCCCVDCDGEDGLSCREMYDVQVITLNLNSWTWVSSNYGKGNYTATRTLQIGPYDDAFFVNTCCEKPNGVIFGATTGLWCDETKDHPFWQGIENGVYKYGEPYGAPSYSNINPDRDGLSLDFKFDLKLSASGYSMHLTKVTGPTGFNFNDTFNSNGVIYTRGWSELLTWPCSELTSFPAYYIERELLSAGGSGFKCYCNRYTNIFDEDLTWGQTWRAGYSHTNGTPSNSPIYRTIMAFCDADQYGWSGTEACGHRLHEMKIVVGKPYES